MNPFDDPAHDREVGQRNPTRDTTRIDDTRIDAVRPLITPALLMEKLPGSLASLALVERSRQAIARVLHGQDDRLVVVSADIRKILKSMGQKLGNTQPANHLPAILVGAPSLEGKPVGKNRFYGANDPRRNTGLAMGYWFNARLRPTRAGPTQSPTGS